jgi:hypothetical protein
MKPATIKQLKDEIQHYSAEELRVLLLRLARFKAENKELLTYLLFEAHDEAAFVQAIKKEMDTDFSLINTASPFYIKKSLRKILRKIRKYSRYSSQKETEVELLLYFTRQLKNIHPPIQQYSNLLKIYHQQLMNIGNKLPKLHEDLQYDVRLELDELTKLSRHS